MTTPYVGEIRLFGFSRIPSGWLACDGSEQSIAGNEVLFTLLGTTYGGNGQTTFGVPDLRGQLPVHMGTGMGLSPRVIGQAGGSEQVTLESNQLPAHTHPLQVTTAGATVTVPGSTVQPGTLAKDSMYATNLAGATPIIMAASAVSSGGGNQPHNNVMPTQTVSFCIAAQGIFPSQG